MISPNPFELFVQKWSTCTKCELHKERTHVVLARGTLPCKVCFIGRAPGYTEDTDGNPFRGEDGRRLDRIIADSVPTDIDYCMTNMVCCLPRVGTTLVDPSEESVRACSERLHEFIALARPKLIVCVGKFAAEWLDPWWKHGIHLTVDDKPIPMVTIEYPAHIARKSVVTQQQMTRRCVIVIRDAIEKYVTAPTPETTAKLED